jgi:hypothetical protein
MRPTPRGEFFLRAMLSDAWSAVTARPARSAGCRSTVLVHDPQAHKPKNLDDPFINPDVQQRIGKLIARAASAQSPKI